LTASFFCLLFVEFLISTKNLNSATNTNKIRDFMTSHGFGGVKLQSGLIPNRDIIDVAKQISRIEPVVWAHVVDKSKSRVSDENRRYDIIFEFDELDKECYNIKSPDGLTRHDVLKAIIQKTCTVPGHETIADLWVINSSHHKGC